MKVSNILLVFALLLSVSTFSILLPKPALTQEEENNLLVQGKRQAEAGNFEQAIQSLDRVIELNPELAEVYTIRAYSFLGIGKKDSAIINFQEAAEIYSRKGDNQRSKALRSLIREIQVPSGGFD